MPPGEGSLLRLVRLGVGCKHDRIVLETDAYASHLCNPLTQLVQPDILHSQDDRTSDPIGVVHDKVQSVWRGLPLYRNTRSRNTPKVVDDLHQRRTVKIDNGHLNTLSELPRRRNPLYDLLCIFS